MESVLDQSRMPDAVPNGAAVAPIGESIWSVPPGRLVRFRPRLVVLVVLLLVPMTLTAALGTISFSAPDDTAIASFWPAAAFQIVFSIWFGVYGAVAGTVGPMLGNGLIGESPLLFVPANAIQSILPGLWFRRRLLDPRLRSRRDWIELIVVGVVLTNGLGASCGVTESFLRRLASGAAMPEGGFWAGRFAAWFVGNTVPCLLLVPALLLAASGLLVSSPFFCRRFFGGADRSAVRPISLRFDDLPIVVKLLLLTLVAGVLPLSALAGLLVYETVRQADYLAGQVNRDAAVQIRDEIERHELMLRMWTAELDRPGWTEADRADLLADWSRGDGFDDLRIVPLSELLAELSPALRKALAEHPVVFYTPPHSTDPRALRGVARLDGDPDRTLAGEVVWRDERPLTGQLAGVEAVIVLDRHGSVLYRDGPGVLASWRPAARRRDGPYTVGHGGRRWHVGESDLERLGWRFCTLTGVKTGTAVVLARVPNALAALINLALFGSLIFGFAIARRATERVLGIAERVRSAGGEPGRLVVPVGGRDEIGVLAEALNHMSLDLADHVLRLQEATAEKERLEAEMELARQVQQKILPQSPPPLDGYELAAACRPAREVGGDFFDYFSGPDGRLTLMIGDAVGKGLKAAMIVAETHGMAHGAALNQPTPERILAAVNRAMVSTWGESSEFVTMLVASLDLSKHCLLYANAGHHPPIHARAEQARCLELGSMPLALFPDTDYQLNQVQLEPGDTVVMFTDGVTEAAREAHEMFQLERLTEVVREHHGQPAGAMLDAILSAVGEFTGGAPQADDITVMVLHRRGDAI